MLRKIYIDSYKLFSITAQNKQKKKHIHIRTHAHIHSKYILSRCLNLGMTIYMYGWFFFFSLLFYLICTYKYLWLCKHITTINSIYLFYLVLSSFYYSFPLSCSILFYLFFFFFFTII